MEGAAPLLRILDQGGIIGLLIIILVGGLRRWWVFGWIYQEATEDRDRYRELALRGTSLAEKGADTAETVLRKRIEALDQEVALLQRDKNRYDDQDGDR